MQATQGDAERTERGADDTAPAFLRQRGQLIESTLESINDSIENFNVTIEVDNIATIKDLVRKELGVSILPKSACMDELSKGKLAALPIENLSMVRETRIVYNRDFSHFDILQEITKTYQETAKTQR